MVVIIDYGMGNIRSIEKKIRKIGYEVAVAADPKTIQLSDKIILPGVGHFKKAIENIKQLKLWDTLNEQVLKEKKPILGICLGMQLMGKHSEEGDAKGFGWIDAEVVKFNIKNKLHYKIPHIGWNQIEIKKKSNIFKNINNEAYFYFVHSYYMKCNDSSDILAETVYEHKFVSAVEHENIIGLQFHPEKSHENGEIILRNFLEK